MLLYTKNLIKYKIAVQPQFACKICSADRLKNLFKVKRQTVESGDKNMSFQITFERLGVISASK